MVIVKSTIPGFVSIRNEAKGSWLIQALVRAFSTSAYDLELVDILRQTSKALSTFKSKYGDKQTCSIDIRHLYKRVYFPKHPDQKRQRSRGTWFTSKFKGRNIQISKLYVGIFSFLNTFIDCKKVDFLDIPSQIFLRKQELVVTLRKPYQDTCWKSSK